MQDLKLNETPVRTSRNFNINNIKLESVNIPEKIGSFSNIKIINESDDIKVENSKTKCNLKYGLDTFLTNQVENKSNQNLKITIDGKKNKTLEIDFLFNSDNNELVENIDITVKKNSKGIVILKYMSKDNLEFYHNGIIKVHGEANSNITVIIVNLLNQKANNFVSIENLLEENSKLMCNMIEFGGKNNIVNFYSNLLGNNSENLVNTIYLGKEKQLIDLNYIGELRGEKSNINIEVQGALKDNSRKNFKGTIDFKKGCKKSKGNENESCMLLSDTSHSLALPMLLCSEEEVEGNHSSSSGKVDEKELFYIMTRGFDIKSAIKLIVRAKFNKVLENILNEELKEQILQEIDERLN